MKPASESNQRRMGFGAVFAFAFALTILCPGTALSQNQQLSLADLLTGLRSKKVSLDQRNEILSTAVSSRGVTFSLTPEIERELLATGAKSNLLDSIRKRSSAVKLVPVLNPESRSEPEPPPPPDYAFFEKRAASSAAVGNSDEAIADYAKAIEMNPGAISSHLGRGNLYMTKGSYDLAIKDFDAVLEKLPKNAFAIAGRAKAYEIQGTLELARNDYAKLAELEPDNQSAKTSLTRIQDELNKIAEAQKPKPEAPAKAEPVQVRPEILNVGMLTEADTLKLVKPVYSHIASRARIGGRVTVEVTLDENGKVKAAKAVSGPSILRAESEAAAMRSKFRPRFWNGEPISAQGQITYNFVAPL